MKLGLLVVLAVAAVVPSEGRAVSKCELKRELESAISVPRSLQKYKEKILAIIVCEVNRRSGLKTDLVNVFGNRKTTTTGMPTVAPTQPEVDETTVPEVEDTTAPEVEDTTAPEVEDTTAPEVEDTTVPKVEDTTEPEVNEMTSEEPTPEPETFEPTTIEEPAPEPGTFEPTATGETTEAQPVGLITETAMVRRKRDADSSEEEEESLEDLLEEEDESKMENDSMSEEEEEEEEDEVEEEVEEEEDDDDNNSTNEDGDEEVKESGERKKRSFRPKRPKKKYGSLGLYGIFQLSDMTFCDSGYRWSRDLCQTDCQESFTDDDIMDDIDCIVKTGYWWNLLKSGMPRCYRISKNYFDECE